MSNLGSLSNLARRNWLAAMGAAVTLGLLLVSVPCPPSALLLGSMQGLVLEGSTQNCCGDIEETIEDDLSLPPSYWDKKRNANPSDYADLIAQQDMANSARSLLFLTCWQIYLSAIGSVAIILALFYSAQSTRAANEANRIAMRNYLADHRPLLVFKDMQHRTEVRRGVMCHMFAFRWINAGNSPAMRMNMWHMLKIIEPDTKTTDITFTFPPTPEFTQGNLGPGMPVGSGYIGFSSEWVEVLARGEKRVVTICRIEYESLISDQSAEISKWHTEICFEILCIATQIDETAVEYDFDYRPIGPHNTAT